MTKGYVLIASGKDYVKQACLCAMSIKLTQKIQNVSIITNDTVEKQFENLFDHIIEIPWHEETVCFYDTQNRWKAYHVSPYEETIVLDTDMLFLSDLSHHWDIFNRYDVCLVEKVRTYKNETVTDDYYRKTFTENNLPNVYNAYQYFKKNDNSLKYYKNLKHIVRNWQSYYKEYLPKNTPRLDSMDVNHAICMIHNNNNNYKTSSIDFVHMKSKIQNVDWQQDSWVNEIQYFVGDDLKIGNYKQHGLFHYVDNNFCNTVFETYKEKYNAIS